MVVTSHPEPALEAIDLAASYGRSRVLDRIDLALNSGRLTGIIGPNGSGKSTLIGLLCGLMTPERGRVELLGRDLTAYPRRQVARLVGLVDQVMELSPGFSVLETVLSGRFAVMGSRLFENEEDIRAADRTLEAIGLTELRDRPAGSLSGGERQRLALARALVAGPRILLLDEPTSALDLEHQLKVMSLLEHSCRAGDLAVCLVSHDLNLASIFCDRLVLLGKGRILAKGRPEEVLTAELIERAYGARVVVDAEPSRGRARVTPIPPPAPTRSAAE